MSWQHVVCRQFLADMGDTQISWLNELLLQNVRNCCILSSTLLGGVFYCLLLLHVVTWQKSMLLWHHICHVHDMSQNVACCWRCCRPACYSDIQQFQLNFAVNQFITITFPIPVALHKTQIHEFQSYIQKLQNHFILSWMKITVWGFEHSHHLAWLHLWRYFVKLKHWWIGQIIYLYIMNQLALW